MIIDPTGKPKYSSNDIARQQNEEGILKALPLTPEEEARAKQEEMRAQQEKRITLNKEKQQESAWTETKLKILALQGAQKRTSDKKNPKEIDMPAGSIQENLAKVDPILVEKLNEKFGDPREFLEDMTLILSGFENEKLVIEGNEMQQLNEYGKKYLLGLLIQKHIFEQGFSITIDANNQPVLRDERGDSTTRQEQMKGLQDVLKQFEFQNNSRHPLRRNDNSSLLAEYITAGVHEKHPNLVDYRNTLARKVGITSPTISPEQAENILKSTTLTPEEKSFLLAWQDTRKDKTLIEIGKQQETFVKYARENLDKKTPETHMQELAERPFTKSAQLLAGGAIGAALLYFAYKQIKKGGVWGTISGVIAGLIGGSIMLPLGDKAWKALGASEWGKDRLEGKPVDREQAKDNPFGRIDTQKTLESIKNLWSNLCTRMNVNENGINILMNPEVGQDITKTYPVYSMLSSLNPDKTNPAGRYESPNTRISQGIIGNTLNKLPKTPEDQQKQLNSLLENTWERYQKTEQYKKEGDDKAKLTTLDTMLAAIELEDGWLNKIIDPFSNTVEKKAALRVIGQNPKAWGDIKVHDLYTYFVDESEENTSIQALIEEYQTKYPDGGNPQEIMKKYFESIKISDTSSSTLKEFLKKQYLTFNK